MRVVSAQPHCHDHGGVTLWGMRRRRGWCVWQSASANVSHDCIKVWKRLRLLVVVAMPVATRFDVCVREEKMKLDR